MQLLGNTVGRWFSMNHLTLPFDRISDLWARYKIRRKIFPY